MSIIHDFPTIAKHARLKALDGTPQNVVQPMGVQVDDGEQFDGYGMYAFDPALALPAETHIWSVWPVDTAPTSHVYWMDATGSLIDLSTAGYDTAPSEWSAPEQDGA